VIARRLRDAVGDMSHWTTLREPSRIWSVSLRDGGRRSKRIGRSWRRC
jgi:hypothetical protein